MVSSGTAEVTLEKAPPAAPEPDRPGRRSRRPERSAVGRGPGAAARRGRLVLVALVLVVAGAGVLAARGGVADARVEARAQGAERAGAAEERAAVEAAEEAATAEEATAADLAAEARAAHNEQRRRLAALGLNERTIDAFLERVTANTELVEYQRDTTSAQVDRQAAEIPQMQECRRVAAQALNAAWNSATFGDAPAPAPSDLCQALMDAGTS